MSKLVSDEIVQIKYVRILHVLFIPIITMCKILSDDKIYSMLKLGLMPKCTCSTRSIRNLKNYGAQNIKTIFLKGPRTRTDVTKVHDSSSRTLMQLTHLTSTNRDRAKGHVST